MRLLLPKGRQLRVAPFKLRNQHEMKALLDLIWFLLFKNLPSFQPGACSTNHLQVVAVTVRSIGRVGQPLPAPELEMDYPSVLNRALPEDIRVTGWAPVPDDFSAR